MRSVFFVFAALFCLGTILQLSIAQAQTSGEPGANAETDKRLQRLEEQIVDLSAQLGTVETLAKGGGGGAAFSPGQPGPAAGSFGGSSDANLSDIETQVRALSTQLEQILRRLDQLEQRSGGLAPPLQPGETGTNYANASPDRLDTQPAEQGTGFSVGGNEPPQNPSGFGTTVEQPSGATNGGDSPGLSGYFSGGSSSQDPSQAGGGTPQPIRTAAVSSPQAQTLYGKAHDALVQRNYRSAANDFEQFVQNFPADPLAGPAYYWLGEAAFTNGQYQKAADSFLKSSTSYPQNEKAAESLLKLGISLRRLGEQNAACTTFDELNRRFPDATPIIQRAAREKSRAQC